MRRDDRSVTQSTGYFLTPEGADDMRSAEVCLCPSPRYERNALVCPECGTVYGVATIKTFRSGWSRMQWEVDFSSLQPGWNE